MYIDFWNGSGLEEENEQYVMNDSLFIAVPPDQCLLGCVFYIADYQKSVGSDETSTWIKIIEQYGGKVSPVYIEAVTHFLCSDQRLDNVKLVGEQ